MNTTRSPGTAFGMVMLFTLVLSGCYTHLETARDGAYYDEKYVEESDTTAVDSSGSETITDNYYDDYGYGSYTGYRLGFSYYYPSRYWPSYAFSAAYYNPWYHHHYGSYPFYGHYSGYYYNPYYYNYGYTATGYGVQRGTRDFGSTRGDGGRRTAVSTRGYNDLISATRSSRSVRRGRSSPSYQPNRGTSRRSLSTPQRFNSGGRRQGGSENSGRSLVPSSRPSRPSFSSPRSSGGFRGGGFGGGGGSRGGGSRGNRR